MPKLTRVFVKAAFLYLILALVVGIILSFPGGSPIGGLFAPYLHLLTFGWLTQLIFGVALWMFPRYSREKPRGHEWLGWATFALLNTGLVLRVIFEPLGAASPSVFAGWMLAAAALLQWLAGVAFVANTWTRVREK